MPAQCQVRLLRRHTVTIVRDDDAPEATTLDLHLDPTRTGVERVLDELLDDGRGTLDHLASGDLVRERGRQETDARGHDHALPQAP